MEARKYGYFSWADGGTARRQQNDQSRSVNIQLRAGSKLFPDTVISFITLYPECKLHVNQSGRSSCRTKMPKPNE
jgi:hypothetical protein